MLAAGKNWGSRDPWKNDLLSPTLTILSSADGYADIKVDYQIPKFADWKRSTVKSSIDGAVSILNAPTGLSGVITDQGSTLLKPTWNDTVFATIRLPAAANMDFLWIEHEYEFGGVLNSLVTPLPPGTTTTTTTTSTTTTTTSSSTTTLGTTTTSTTTTEPTTTTTLRNWYLNVKLILLNANSYKYKSYIGGDGTPGANDPGFSGPGEVTLTGGPLTARPNLCISKWNGTAWVLQESIPWWDTDVLREYQVL